MLFSDVRHCIDGSHLTKMLHFSLSSETVFVLQLVPCLHASVYEQFVETELSSLIVYKTGGTMKIVHSFRRALGRNKRRLHHEPVCSKLNMYIGCNLFRSDPLKMVLS